MKVRQPLGEVVLCAERLPPLKCRCGLIVGSDTVQCKLLIAGLRGKRKFKTQRYKTGKQTLAPHLQLYSKVITQRLHIKRHCDIVFKKDFFFCLYVFLVT